MNQRASSHVAVGLVLAVALFSPVPVASAAGADVDRRLAECAGLSDPSDRLACFDSIAADRAASSAVRPRAAEQRPAAPTQPAPPPVVQTPASPAAEDPTPSAQDDSGFGAEMLERADAKEEDRGPQQIAAELVRLEQQPHGERIFYLSNDQIWVELAPGRGRFREGQSVTVRRALMGSYMLQADGVRAARVRRVR